VLKENMKEIVDKLRWMSLNYIQMGTLDFFVSGFFILKHVL